MPAPADTALVDTNVLVYALFPAAPHHAASRALIFFNRSDFEKVQGLDVLTP